MGVFHVLFWEYPLSVLWVVSMHAFFCDGMLGGGSWGVVCLHTRLRLGKCVYIDSFAPEACLAEQI